MNHGIIWYHMASISLGTSIFQQFTTPSHQGEGGSPGLVHLKGGFRAAPRGFPPSAGIQPNSAEVSSTCWRPAQLKGFSLEIRESWSSVDERKVGGVTLFSENFKRLLPGSLCCRTKLRWHKVPRVRYHKGGTEVLEKVSDCKGEVGKWGSDPFTIF